MTKPLDTRYALHGDIHIAYQVVGSGPIDLVMLPGLISHLELQWEQDPRYRSWVRRLASFSRLILLDARGTGLSDRDVGDATLDERVDDLTAVLDAVGSTRCALIGFSVAGALAIRMATRHPQRVSSLVLCNAFASTALQGADVPPAGLAQIQRLVDTAWGEGRTLEIFGPSLWGHAVALSRMARLERAGLSPRAARTHLARISATDVRAEARDLRLPTLVLHRTQDTAVPVELGRWLGFHIPGARYVEQSDGDHLIWYGNQNAALDEIQQFLTGSLPDEDIDRFLATVVFTDIVDSTDHLARRGDRAWVETLARHHDIVRRLLAQFHGQEQDTAGDGFFATFGLPARAVRCALAIRDAVQPLGIQVRVGLHTGECLRRGDTVVGISVHTAARIMALAQAGEVLVSRTVTDLVAGSGLQFQDRGSHALKSVPGEWRLFRAGD
jgi:class 3 adenylate cyclase